MFLRTYSVLQVERAAFPTGWAFCVEWLDGTGVGSEDGSPLPFYRAVPKVRLSRSPLVRGVRAICQVT